MLNAIEEFIKDLRNPNPVYDLMPIDEPLSEEQELEVLEWQARSKRKENLHETPPPSVWIKYTQEKNKLPCELTDQEYVLAVGNICDKLGI